MTGDSVFNLPKQRHLPEQRYVFLEQLMHDLFQGREFSLLEIGVDAGEFPKALFGSDRVAVSRVTGVDPYVGRDDQFLSVQSQFAKMGFELIRARSHEAWRKDIGRFDCIYVDGLHDYLSTFEDMALWFFRMTPKGTMIVDDYGFVGWPEKTKAVNDFIRIAEPLIDALGYRSYHVYTGLEGNWPIPAEKSNVLIRAGDLSDARVVEGVIRKMKAVLADGKRPDIFPNVGDVAAG